MAVIYFYSNLQNMGENVFEHFYNFVAMLYHTSDILMIMYLGNEIKLSSDQLSHCLFESNWFDQPQKTKKIVFIFGELLKQPHELVVGTLYALNLETFTRVSLTMKYQGHRYLNSFFLTDFKFCLQNVQHSKKSKIESFCLTKYSQY